MAIREELKDIQFPIGYDPRTYSIEDDIRHLESESRRYLELIAKYGESIQDNKERHKADLEYGHLKPRYNECKMAEKVVNISKERLVFVEKLIKVMNQSSVAIEAGLTKLEPVIYKPSRIENEEKRNRQAKELYETKREAARELRKIELDKLDAPQWALMDVWMRVGDI